jgi:hypothetical protein
MSVCVFNKSGPHKQTYQLKPEYAAFKEQGNTEVSMSVEDNETKQ